MLDLVLDSLPVKICASREQQRDARKQKQDTAMRYNQEYAREHRARMMRIRSQSSTLQFSRFNSQ
jgi:hypothetical protein